MATEARDRADLIRSVFRLEWLTVGWMLVEAGVALGAGIAAGSLALTAFGLDSLIELASAGVLIWRLTMELRRGRAFSEGAERRASRIAGQVGQLVLGAWWIDPIASLGVLWFVVREAREAWSGDSCCD
jgi:divalent metal cation (Fe/Co/Zn/Cd) transporter